MEHSKENKLVDIMGLKVLINMFFASGETFVTRKITRAVAKIHLGLQDSVRAQ